MKNCEFIKQVIIIVVNYLFCIFEPELVLSQSLGLGLPVNTLSLSVLLHSN